jgi:tetratricopeptide (TPR) repeat protein
MQGQALLVNTSHRQLNRAPLMRVIATGGMAAGSVIDRKIELYRRCEATGCPSNKAFRRGSRCQNAYQSAHEQDSGMSHVVVETEGGQMHVRVAQARLEAGVAYLNQGQYAEAERCFRSAMWIFRKVHGDEHADVGWACQALGDTYCRTGKYDEAFTLYEESLEIFRIVHGNSSPEAGGCLIVLGGALECKGKLEEALSKLEEALSIFDQTLGARHANVHAGKGREVDTQRNSLVPEDLRGLGQFTQAVEMYDKALAIHRCDPSFLCLDGRDLDGTGGRPRKEIGGTGIGLSV